MAKIVKADRKASRSMLTKVQGMIDFMPPECLVDNPTYDTSLDVFSYAGIVLHVINQEWPTPTALVSQDPQTGNPIAHNEVKRRQVYIDKMKDRDKAKVLQPFVKECLKNIASERPLTSDVLKRLEQLSVCDFSYWLFSYNSISYITCICTTTCAIQRCNRVNITDPDNPLTHRVIWVRPRFDLFLTHLMIKYSNCTVNASCAVVKC